MTVSLASIHGNADAPGTTVLVGCASFAVANFLLDDRWLLFDEILSLIEMKTLKICFLFHMIAFNESNLIFEAKFM
jgi:hypothetical protein